MILRHPVLEKLYELRFRGMAKAYEEQLNTEDITKLTFDDRLGLMVDREDAERAARSLRRRLQVAKLRFPQACVLAFGDSAPTHHPAVEAAGMWKAPLHHPPRPFHNPGNPHPLPPGPGFPQPQPIRLRRTIVLNGAQAQSTVAQRGHFC